MRAVILAARKKDSLYPLSDSKPLGLMPVGGTPLVERLVEQLQEAGINQIDIVVNHLSKEYEEYFNGESQIRIVRQEKPSGTADAVKEAGNDGDSILVVNGDVVLDYGDLEKLKNSHENFATVLATDEDKPEKFGVLGIRDNHVVDLSEKPDEPESPLVNTGTYVFEPGIFDFLEDENSIVEALGKALSEKDVKYELAEGYWIDIGSFRKLKEADRKVRAAEAEYLSEKATVSNGSEVENSIVMEGAEIASGSVVKDSFIGKNSVIGPNSVVKDSTVGENCILEQCSIRKSILFEENIVDSFVSIESSIISEDCDFKEGSIVRESYIGRGSFIEMNNSIFGTKFVPEARTDLGEISK